MSAAVVPGQAVRGADAFAAAHARVLADRSIQFALPHAPTPHVPAWLRALIHAIGTAWPVLRVLIWIALGAVALFSLWQIARRLGWLRWPWAQRADDEAVEGPAEWRPEAAPARALLAEADRLAAEGRYGEAARLVLHRSVEDIGRRRPGVIHPATTSRDLMHSPALPIAALPAFTLIAEVVETSLFADRGATADAWTRARGAYADFALAGNWR